MATTNYEIPYQNEVLLAAVCYVLFVVRCCLLSGAVCCQVLTARRC